MPLPQVVGERQSMMQRQAPSQWVRDRGRQGGRRQTALEPEIHGARAGSIKVPLFWVMGRAYDS
jgi:hypothetical protein